MTRRERLERKLAKRREWAESAKNKSNQRLKSAMGEIEGIPPGQPILVGHHSERRHRRALEKHDNKMRQACELADKAKHHAGKAGGLEDQLEGSIFSDDPDAIERIEEHITELEARRQANNAINRIVRAKPKHQVTEEKIEALQALGLSESTARKVFEPDFCGRIGIPSYVNQNLGGNITRLRKRISHIKAMQERAENAEAVGGCLIVISGDYARVTFSEKPDRSIINDLKEANYRWCGGSWSGRADQLPESVAELGGQS